MPWTLITGASEGLGREFAWLAADEGRNLILAARSEDKLEALAGELRAAHGIEVVVIHADLAESFAGDTLWDSAISEGREIDLLVNNAGLGRYGQFAEGDWERELTSIRVNVEAATALMKHAVIKMTESGGGAVLNVASTAGFVPGPNMAVYHATKAFLLSLSEAIAEELKGSNVSVTVLCPGPTATNFQADAEMESANLLKVLRSSSARSVALAGWRGMKARRRIVVPGAMNKLTAFAPRIAPRRLATWITGKLMKSG